MALSLPAPNFVMSTNRPHPMQDFTLPSFSRRTLLKTLSSGFGYLAFAGLAHRTASAKPGNPLAPKAPHFPARAKRVIFLCMGGGPSHVDTFDYKPKLIADDGKVGPRPGTKLLGSNGLSPTGARRSLDLGPVPERSQAR